VSLLQGTKAYGVHLHPIPIPAKERAPRDEHENFYWLQEDYLRAVAADRGLRWTIFRPQIITGGAIGVAMNLVPVIGVYAAIAQRDGSGFAYPGGPSYVLEATDARLLAAAFEWAAEAESAADQHFNITNGDVFEWRDLWPALAEELGVDVAPDEPRRMGTWLPDRAAVWDDVVRAHGLRPLPLGDVLGESHHYADFGFAHGARKPPPPALVSTVKIRQAGFSDCLDTEDSFRYWLDVLRRRGVLPGR
jgi:nucleoside-diphosphate-sugar epimerase